MKLLAFRICGFLFVALLPLASKGQVLPVNWTGGGGVNNNWTTFANWDEPTGGLPTGFFDETAVISNGGTALVNSDLNTLSLPDGPPGGLAVSNSSTLQIVAGGAFLTQTGPHADGTASFTGGGKLSINSATASFASTSLSFSGGGIYNPIITSNTQGLISVTGNVNLGGGTLRPAIGYSPTAPRSWTLIDAAAINGALTLDTSSAGLSLGQKLTTSLVAGGINGQQLRLNLNNVLALTVNADTGAASINSPTGTPIVITGYGVASTAGQLNPSGWSTLASQIGGGWGVAGTPSTTHLDELGGPIPPGNTTQASLSINATARAIGSPFKVQKAFGVVPNVSFQYVQSGQLVDGSVQVTGNNVINNLLLTVDPSTGQATLKNSSAVSIKLQGYSVLSDSGALKPTWNSLHDQGVTGVDEANTTSTHLSELIPSVANTLTLAPGQSYAMGALFDTTKSRDLKLEFDFAGLAGDFNKNGTVDAADYTVWRDKLGAGFTSADYTTWKNNFGASNPAGGGPLIMTGVVSYQSLGPGSAASVPEPPTIYLAAILLGIVLVARKEVR